MYLEHFGLSEFPYSITPDTGFFFEYGSHQEALNVLLVTLKSGEGFIKVTGEVGTGKTLLCRRLLNELPEKQFQTAYIPNPNLSTAALYSALADELGLEHARNIGQHRLLKKITEHLIDNAGNNIKTVLLIDEAQAIPLETMEALRLLTNLETEKSKLLQVILFGQPELDQNLAKPSIRQLKQRIGFSSTLQALDKNAIGGYVQHRLTVAGCPHQNVFSNSAIDLISKYSRGVPRLINQICHKCLMLAYGKGQHNVNVKMTRRAIEDTEGAYALANRSWMRPLLGFTAALAAGMSVYVWGFML